MVCSGCYWFVVAVKNCPQRHLNVRVFTPSASEGCSRATMYVAFLQAGKEACTSRKRLAAVLRVAEPLAVLIQPDQNKDTDEQGQEHPERKDDSRNEPVHLVSGR